MRPNLTSDDRRSASRRSKTLRSAAGGALALLLVSSASPARSATTTGVVRRAAVTTPVTVTGTYLEGHGDSFDTGVSVPIKELTTSAGVTYRVHLPAATDLASGSTARITGAVAADASGTNLTIDATSATALAPPPTSGAGERTAAVTGNFNTLVVNIYWEAPTAPTTSTTTTRDTINGFVNSLYGTMSNGTVSFTATSTPWIKIPLTGCASMGAVSAAANTLLPALGYHLADYGKVAYYFPRRTCYTFDGLNIGYGNAVYINGDDRPFVVAHELGHSFGLTHAKSVTCNGTALPVSLPQSTIYGIDVTTDCREIGEYGDPFDVMGSGGKGQSNSRTTSLTSYSFNTTELSKLGWLPDSQVKQLSATASTFRLDPTIGSGSSRAAVIQKTVNDNVNLWLEYRTTNAVDTKLLSNEYVRNTVTGPTTISTPGVALIRYFDRFAIYPRPSTHLFDATPQNVLVSNQDFSTLYAHRSNGNFVDGSMKVCQPIRLPSGGSITLLGGDANGATFRYEPVALAPTAPTPGMPC